MKKTYSSPSISASLILIGVLINGFAGNTLELIAHLIDTFNGKSSTKLFLQQLFIIVLSQITINWVFADNSMTVDMTIWLVEKNYKMIWDGIQMWVTVGNLFTLVRIVNIKTESIQFHDFFSKDQNQNQSEPKLISISNMNCS